MGNLNTEMEIMRKNPMQVLEMKNTFTKVKCCLTSRLDKSEKVISEFEDRSIKIIQAET